jgi:hypothetical protein
MDSSDGLAWADNTLWLGKKLVNKNLKGFSLVAGFDLLIRNFYVR